MSHNLLFTINTDPKKSKSTCLFFGHSKHNANIKCIMFGNKALPFVANAKHLGNILDVLRHQQRYISEKRYYHKINGVLQEFNFGNPRTKYAVMQNIVRVCMVVNLKLRYLKGFYTF
jgi:hypothetical protein